MLQHIGIAKIDKKGDIIEWSKDNFAPIREFVYDVKDADEKFPLISKIDPYADTKYDISKISDLTNELTQIKQTKIDLKKNIDSIISFLQTTKNYTFIEFVGD